MIDLNHPPRLLDTYIRLGLSSSWPRRPREEPDIYREAWDALTERVEAGMERRRRRAQRGQLVLELGP